MEPVGAPPVGGTVGYAERQPGQRQRCRIGEHVARVGQQGERAREQAASGLHEHEPTREQRSPRYPALVLGMHTAVRVSVPMVVVVAQFRTHADDSHCLPGI